MKSIFKDLVEHDVVIEKLDYRDFVVKDEGTIFLITPETDNAKQWLDENISGESTWYGDSLVCEHRYVEDLIDGMIEAGFKVFRF